MIFFKRYLATLRLLIKDKYFVSFAVQIILKLYSDKQNHFSERLSLQSH